jgi:4-amino-4-deoxy-L-arabinose transferase-like glycosyltransferase
MKLGPLIVLGVLTLGLHAAGAGSLPLIDRDEPRFAEASREMRERGDWIVPYFNNEPRLAKPPLIYWCQAASYALFGETDLAARFPSALAAALTALLVFGFGSRLYDEKTGLWAAIVFSTSLHVLALGKAATADMAMIFFFTAAAWSGWELAGSGEPRKNALFNFWWWIFYSSLALGFLAKGPLAWLPLGSLFIFSKFAKKDGLRRAIHFEWGIPLTLILVALWAVPALMRTNGDYFTVGIGKNVLGRSLGAMEGHGGRDALTYLLMLPFYFVTVFASFWPWSLYLPGLLRRLKDPATRGPREIYLLSLILPVFLVFTLVATKLPHYTLPAFPFLALLLTHFTFSSGRPLKLLTLLSAGTAAAALACALFLFPLAARTFPAAELARQSAPWLTPEMEFASVDFNEPSLVWAFRKYVSGWHHALSAEEAEKFMRKPGPRFCVLPASWVDRTFPGKDPDRKIFQHTGIDPAKGKRVDLTMLVKAD